MLLAATMVGIAVVLMAAWLVWTRPSLMTWGFFAYAVWFNPGQTYTYYALITHWPRAVLAQELAEAVAQAAAYVGLLVFALRFPHDTTEPVWRPVERALAPIAVILLILKLLSFANGFGYPTEAITRWTFYAGMMLDAGVLVILLRRRRQLAAQDEQRMCWVIAGCAIGLPAFFVAELRLASSAVFRREAGTHSAAGQRCELGRGVAEGARPGGGRRRPPCRAAARPGPADRSGLGPPWRARRAGPPLYRVGRARCRARAAGRGTLRPAPRRQRSRSRRACDAGHDGRAGRRRLRARRDRGAPARDHRAAGAAGGAKRAAHSASA